MDNFTQEFNKIKDSIKDYTLFDFYLNKNLDSKEIIGLNCSASSLIRKPVTLARIKEVIDSTQANLEIEEIPNTRYFKIQLNEYNN